MLIFNLVILLFTYIFGDYIFLNYIPSLHGGSKVFLILIFGITIYTFLPGFGNIMMVLKQQSAYLKIQLISISLSLIVVYLTLNFNFGIEGIAWSVVTAIVSQTLMTILYVLAKR
jgi:Na+-driven multidrug efflux pump